MTTTSAMRTRTANLTGSPTATTGDTAIARTYMGAQDALALIVVCYATMLLAGGLIILSRTAAVPWPRAYLTRAETAVTGLLMLIGAAMAWSAPLNAAVLLLGTASMAATRLLGLGGLATMRATLLAAFVQEILRTLQRPPAQWS